MLKTIAAMLVGTALMLAMAIGGGSLAGGKQPAGGQVPVHNAVKTEEVLTPELTAAPLSQTTGVLEPTAPPSPDPTALPAPVPTFTSTPALPKPLAELPGEPLTIPAEWISFSQPHPILGDWRVRRALAYCTDRDGLLQAVYPELTAAQRQALHSYGPIPSWHWAYAGDSSIAFYEFNPSKGQALLEEAGWSQPSGRGYRVNVSGQELNLTLTTTTAAFRQSWAEAWEGQLAQCGIRLTRNHVESNWFFAAETGLGRREFEMAAYTWVADPLYASYHYQIFTCGAVPLPENNWEGQNYSGWCNPSGDDDLYQANFGTQQPEVLTGWRDFQSQFTQALPVLPLFTRRELYAFRSDVTGFDPQPGEAAYTWDADRWQVNGKDQITIGMSYEPEALYGANLALEAALIRTLIEGKTYTVEDGAIQPLQQSKLPGVENGLVNVEEVQVASGERVIGFYHEVSYLENGVRVIDGSGKLITYTGGSLGLPQFTVRYEFAPGLSWSDHQPVMQADYELAYRAACLEYPEDPGYLCDTIEHITFDDDGYTITYLPGNPGVDYALAPFGFYPSHRRLSDGRLQGNVSPQTWQELEEIARAPLGAGPYQILEWVTGSHILLEANPAYFMGAPRTRWIRVLFLPEDEIETALLSGRIDLIGPDSLYSVSSALSAAARQGEVIVSSIPTGSWEHIDFALFTNR